MPFDPIYCAGCGLRVESPGRVCPKCGEPLPAPPTVIGYGDPGRPPEPQPEVAGSSVFGTSPLAVTPFPAERRPAPQPLPPPIPPEAPSPGIADLPTEPDLQPAPALPSHPPTAQVPARLEPVPEPPPRPDALPAPLAWLPSEPAPPRKPGTEQLAPAPSALQTSGVAPTVPDREPMPEPRPRNRLAGAFLSIWGLLLTIAGLGFAGIHLMMVVQHGFRNLHDAVHAALWVSIALLPAAALQLAAGAANLLGRLAPRALALVALVAQCAWAIAAVVVVHGEFLSQGPVLVLEILSVATILPSLLGAVSAWVGARPRAMVYAPPP